MHVVCTTFGSQFEIKYERRGWFFLPYLLMALPMKQNLEIYADGGGGSLELSKIDRGNPVRGATEIIQDVKLMSSRLSFRFVKIKVLPPGQVSYVEMPHGRAGNEGASGSRFWKTTAA